MKAEPDRWKRLPFADMTPVPYSRLFSKTEYQRLAAGLIPQAMEDKWFIYMDDDRLCFHRSWTGQAVYRVTIRANPRGYSVTEAACAKGLLENCDTFHAAALIDFLISNLVLGESKAFPRPAGVHDRVPGLYQHTISGTAFREAPRLPKPWWKFWQTLRGLGGKPS